MKSKSPKRSSLKGGASDYNSLKIGTSFTFSHSKHHYGPDPDSLHDKDFKLTNPQPNIFKYVLPSFFNPFMIGGNLP